ncbi:hypothetical protein C8R48DRAFT_680242 [Suillus tomentosus]|nr:hypothetical protein C8R48DRAFT_680242 [Suillus tomentosus]
MERCCNLDPPSRTRLNYGPFREDYTQDKETLENDISNSSDFNERFQNGQHGQGALAEKDVMMIIREREHQKAPEKDEGSESDERVEFGAVEGIRIVDAVHIGVGEGQNVVPVHGQEVFAATVPTARIVVLVNILEPKYFERVIIGNCHRALHDKSASNKWFLNIITSLAKTSTTAKNQRGTRHWSSLTDAKRNATD